MEFLHSGLTKLYRAHINLYLRKKQKIEHTIDRQASQKAPPRRPAESPAPPVPPRENNNIIKENLRSTIQIPSRAPPPPPDEIELPKPITKQQTKPSGDPFEVLIQETLVFQPPIAVPSFLKDHCK